MSNSGDEVVSTAQFQKVLQAKHGTTAHYDVEGVPACGAKGEMMSRRVADPSQFVTCAKCRKAEGQEYMVGGKRKPEFNTGRRVFGRYA